jgi:hypothetical protein
VTDLYPCLIASAWLSESRKSEKGPDARSADRDRTIDAVWAGGDVADEDLKRMADARSASRADTESARMTRRRPSRG